MKSLNKAVIFLMLVSVHNIYAQDSDFNLENLKAPGMPSATIIGTQISDINSPKALKDLEAAFFTNYLNSGQGLMVPDNYAIEINPFMLSGRKNFDYRSYLDNNVSSNILRNLSVSVASTNTFIVNDSVSSNAIGISVRTIILNGKPQKEVSDAFLLTLDENQYLNDIKTIVPLLVSRVIKDTSFSYSIDNLTTAVTRDFEKEQLQDDNGKPLTGDELKNKKKLVAFAVKTIKSVFLKINRNTAKDKVSDEFDSIYKREISKPQLEELRKNLAGIKTDRYGFRWDVNWALAVNFPTNNFSYSLVPRWGIWTNLSYKSEEMNHLTFIGLGRFILNNDDYINKYQPVNKNFTTGNSYDLGFKIEYNLDKFSMAVEYIYRLNTNKLTKVIDGLEYTRSVNNDTRKYLININYNISDDINLSYNIGKDFDRISLSNGDLISALSVNFGFGDIKAGDLLKSR